MRTKLALVVLMAAALTGCGALLTPAVRADDTSLGATGGSVYPMAATDVRLDAETVQAVCFGGFAEYRVDFRFVNDSRGRRITLGFPFAEEEWRDRPGGRPIGFQAWCDGRPLRVKAVGASIVAGYAKRGYFVHSAYFPHGATMITVSYLSEQSGQARARTDRSSSGATTGMASWYEYWLHTGATWKGPIGAAVVRYRFADSFHAKGFALTAAEAAKDVPVTTSGWSSPLARTYQWRFDRFEPARTGSAGWWQAQSSSDIVLGFAHVYRPSSPLQARWKLSSNAHAPASGAGRFSLQDGDLTSGWIEGVAGPGVGEWAEATFRRPQRLRELRVVPGNNATLSSFSLYARPKTLRAVFSDGTSALLHVRDAPVLQRFPVDTTTSTVRFVIESVYRGTDYPGTSISEVEFGRARAPGYAAFARLIRDPKAAGRLPSWAGLPAPGPPPTTRTAAWQEAQDAEAVAGGDLIGVDEYTPLPGDEAAFAEPATLEDVTRRNEGVVLPTEALVGKPTAVRALSTWTYEISYTSGIDLAVNTRVKSATTTSVVKELARTASHVPEYTDGRKVPFEVTTIGDKVAGVEKAGTVVFDCGEGDENGRVPAQVFWRDHDRTYHLYARATTVTLADLIRVADGIIEPAAGTGIVPAPAAAQPGPGHPWWWAAILVVVLLAAGVVLYLRRPGRTAVHADGSPR